MTPLLIILIWISIIFGKQIYDWHLIRQKRTSPKHGLETFIMLLLAFIFDWFVVGIHRYEQRFYLLDVTIFQFFSYMAFFDAGLNLMRGLHPLYIGKTAWIDVHVWRKWPNFYTWSKIIALIFVVYGVINIFNHGRL